MSMRLFQFYHLSWDKVLKIRKVGFIYSFRLCTCFDAFNFEAQMFLESLKCFIGPKVPYFFFPGKVWGVLTYLLWALFVFFSCFEKNKQFFFPRKLQKRSKTVKLAPFVEFQFFSLFFFTKNPRKCFF